MNWAAWAAPQDGVGGHGWGVIGQGTLVLAFLVTGASPPPWDDLLPSVFDWLPLTALICRSKLIGCETCLRLQQWDKFWTLWGWKPDKSQKRYSDVAALVLNFVSWQMNEVPWAAFLYWSIYTSSQNLFPTLSLLDFTWREATLDHLSIYIDSISADVQCKSTNIHFKISLTLHVLKM